MSDITDAATYWDAYAARTAAHAAEEPAFGWTQYPHWGPGRELLGSPRTALELGCGRGDAVAALAGAGVDATGIDLSGEQHEYAQRRWGEVDGARFVQADVTEFLSRTQQQWDAVYSIWGAVWFTDPAGLLPLVHDRLAPGGTLVFSHAPPVPGAYGVQGMYANGFKGKAVFVYRWSYEPGQWAALLGEFGFTGINARVQPAPDDGLVGTLIVQAHRGG
ncbi:class I SAM-dependent methyltransferase [Saccharopolyspora taberi]|uniref:Methyltransferase domain-containing protein n=1 Tax=Saccharopolyspora taberi TaxID=60895 RepID=A0ABN3VFU4_9PSEU